MSIECQSSDNIREISYFLLLKDELQVFYYKFVGRSYEEAAIMVSINCRHKEQQHISTDTKRDRDHDPI